MPTDAEPNLKPEIAHILSLDVVGYSKLLVNEQIDLLKQLNRIVRETATFRAAEAEGRLTCLPTGDGMVLLFFRSPEEPLRCATEISMALQDHPHIRVRMGAHSGPVNELEDVNGRPNVAGAGLNTVQRVLDSGDAGHILLSKRLADDLAEYGHWRPYLQDLGECVVKHGVRLHLVNFCQGSIGNCERPEKLRDSQCAPVLPPTRQASRQRRRAISALLCLGLLAAFLAAYFLRPRPSISKSVAVLPFDTLGDPRQLGSFGDGMLIEILRDLTRVADLKVISRISVMKYRDTASLNLKQIAEALQVRYLVLGSIQRSGDKIRVQAQLIDATTDQQRWAERYDGKAQDVFGIQSDIAEKIVSQLQAHLTPQAKAAIETQPTEDLVAYELYLKGKTMIDRVIYDSNRIEDLQDAAQLLEQATARDPRFFLAFCKLAYAHDQIYFNSLDHTDTRLGLAQAALDAAIRLQPDGGEVHFAKAAHYYFGYLDYDRARSELVLARENLPNDPYLTLLLGYIDRREGRWDESTRELEHTVELDPRNLLFLKQLALSYSNLRRYADMTKILDRAIAIAPNDPNFLVQRAGIELDWHADTKPLHAAIDRILAQDPSNASVIADQWLNLALCEEDTTAASKAMEAMSEKGCQEDGLPYPRSWCEGIAARERKDDAVAKLAFEQARIQVARLVHEQPNFAGALSVLGMVDAALGNKEDAIAEGRKAVALLPVGKDAITGPILLQNLAVIYAWTDEKDEAIEELTRLVSLPCYLSYGHLSLHPYWIPLRSEPPFQSILNALRLGQGG